MSLAQRLSRLEAKSGGDRVTLEELITWSYRGEPYDPAMQKEYEDFARRCERSALCRLILKAYRSFVRDSRAAATA
jgi:hypothetical protein